MDNKCNITGTNFSDPTMDFEKLFANCSLDNNGYNYPGRPNGPNKNTETAFKIIFYLLAAIEDLLLLYVIYKDPLKRFRNSPTYFISNFMAADLLSIISGLCDAIFQLMPQKTRHDQEIAGCFSAIGLQCSFLIIMLFASDRYMAITHPYKYQNIMARKIVQIALILIPWCFSIILLPVIYFEPTYKGSRALTNMFAGDIIVLSVISMIVHPLTRWTFKIKMKEIAASSYANKQILTENLKIDKALTTTVLVVSFCLITFISPYLVAFSFNVAECDKCFLNHAFQSFWMYYPLLTSLRLMINSLVYAWRLPLYRRSLKALIVKSSLRLRINRNISSGLDRSGGTQTIKQEQDQTASISLSQCNLPPGEHNNKNSVSTGNLPRNEAEESDEKGVMNNGCRIGETIF